jgi:hypothetical protein
MNGPFGRALVEGVTQRLAVDRDHLALGRLGYRPHPAQKTRLKLHGVKQAKDPIEGVVRGNAPGQFQKLLEPFVPRLSKVLDGRKTLGPAEHGTHGDDQNVAQLMTPVTRNPRIGQNRKVFKQRRRWLLLHWPPPALNLRRSLPQRDSNC